jgi:thiamine kinase-like enzyme
MGHKEIVEVSSVVIAAVEEATGQTFDSLSLRLRPPNTHQSNRLYDVWAGGRHLIAKDFVKEEEWAAAPRREFESLHLLAPLDIAPHPVFYDPRVGPVVVYEFMEGRAWGRYRPSPAELEQLANLSARLHAMPTKGLWFGRSSDNTLASRMLWFAQTLEQYAEWATANFPEGLQAARLYNDLFVQRVELGERVMHTQVEHCFCRSDPRFANIIARVDGRLGMVDWEDAGLRDPALEVADLLLHVEQEDLLSRAEWQPFFDVYWEKSAQDAAEVMPRMEAYCGLLPLFWLTVLIREGMKQARQGTLTDWKINEMPANLRFQRYLARGFAWPKWDFDPATYAEIRFFPTDAQDR